VCESAAADPSRLKNRFPGDSFFAVEIRLENGDSPFNCWTAQACPAVAHEAKEEAPTFIFVIFVYFVENHAVGYEGGWLKILHSIGSVTSLFSSDLCAIAHDEGVSGW